MHLTILSGGAAQSVVNAMAGPFRDDTGCDIVGTFGAVGAMRETLLAGAAADLLILTSALITELETSGHVAPNTRADLGRVRTGVAVRAGDPLPDVSTPEALRIALLEAEAVYFPDPEKATAGVHFARVLDRLGVREDIAARLRPFPNGATAMRELAAAKGSELIGCTQITEIRGTPGVVLVAPLPTEFELATVYTVGVCANAAEPELARKFARLLAGKASRAVREKAGFEL